MVEARCCGTCRLYSENMFRGSRAWKDARACCADAAHEMPASWVADNEMQASDGADCGLWEPARTPTDDVVRIVGGHHE